VKVSIFGLREVLMDSTALRSRTILLLFSLGWVGLAGPAAFGAEFIVETRSSNRFSPANLTIQVGDTVTWRNTSGNHNVEADDGSFRCANGCDATGGNGSPASNAWTFSLTFNTPATISYHCVVHRGLGMTGTIAVVGGPPTQPGSLRFAVDTVTVDESSGSAQLSVQRVSGDDGAVAVSFATANGSATAGSDYSAQSGTLNWADNDDDPKNLSIPILEDTQIENTETLTVTLSSPAGGATVGSPATATVRIRDNDDVATNPGTLAFEAADGSASEGDGTVQIGVARSGGSDGAVGVGYSSADGSATAGLDYQEAAGSLQWASGEGGVKTFGVSLIDDTAPEQAETVLLSLANPTGGATLGTPAASTLTVQDNDVDFGPCIEDAVTLCLGADDRFRVQVRFRDNQARSGFGPVVDIGRRDSGLVYFFNENNIEMLVKILNACSNPAFQTYWVFYAATTNVEFTLTVVDTEADQVKQYFNPLGNPAAPVQDTRAFATCP
jgi:plastocyanin